MNYCGRLTNFPNDDNGMLSLASSLIAATSIFQSGTPSRNDSIRSYAPAMPWVLNASVSSSFPLLKSITAKLKPCLLGLTSLPFSWIDPALSSHVVPSKGGSKQPTDLTSILSGLNFPEKRIEKLNEKQNYFRGTLLNHFSSGTAQPLG